MTRIPNQAVIFLHLQPKSRSNVNTQAKPISSFVICHIQYVSMTVAQIRWPCVRQKWCFSVDACSNRVHHSAQNPSNCLTSECCRGLLLSANKNVSPSRGITKQIYGALCDRQVTNSITNATTNTANVSKADSIIDGTIVRLPSLHPFRQL